MSVYVILLGPDGKPDNFIVSDDEGTLMEYDSVEEAQEKLKEHPYIKAWGGLTLDFDINELEYL